jgi:Tc toxin complex TcA C-terminal TcB-binding domain
MIRKLRVHGEVIDRATQAKIPGVVIEAIRRDANARTTLGRATTNRRGVFTMRVDAGDYSELDFTLDSGSAGTNAASVVREHREGRLSVVVEIDQPKSSARGDISGVLRSAAGYPIAGVSIVVVAATHDKRAAAIHDPLATGRTDGAGRFRLTVENVGAPAALRIVADPDGTGQQVTASVNATDRPTAVQLTMPLLAGPIGTATWSNVAQRMRQARITQVHQLVKQLLSAPGPHAPFGDWSVSQRHAIIAELERAFLDPTGELRARTTLPTLRTLQDPRALADFQATVAPYRGDPGVQSAADMVAAKAAAMPDLTRADWAVDSESLRSGNPAKALAEYRVLPSAGSAEVKVPPKPSGDGGPATGTVDVIEPGDLALGVGPTDADLAGYRDYLRAVWAGVGTTKFFLSSSYPEDPKYPSEDAAVTALNTRFHQDFTTPDTTQRPANEVLIPIVKSILTKPTGKGHGFGIAPASITPQGDRTAREYLDYLIGLSGQTSPELRKRYRIDLTRPDSAMSSPVQENIAALQGFLTDSFQSPLEPYPIISQYAQGVVPFYLQYDEWLWAQRPFFGENVYSPRRPLDLSHLNDSDRKWIESQTKMEWTWVADLYELVSLLEKARLAVQRGQYPTAANYYDDARKKAYVILTHKGIGKFWYYEQLTARKTVEITNADDVRVLCETKPGGLGLGDTYDEWLDHNRLALLTATALAYYRTIPAGIAEVALKLGDYALAVSVYGLLTNFWVATARFEAIAGFPGTGPAGPETYLDGDLAYGSGLGKNSAVPRTVRDWSGTVLAQSFYTLPYPPDHAHDPTYQHPVEAAYFRLRQAEAMLEWAEALYRSDQLGQVARAREMYKAVLWIHGVFPDIRPLWPGQPMLFAIASSNPTVLAQTTRATLRLAQIDAGLNYLGYSPDHVPVLRYRPLREAADRFAALAKAAQQDFLLAMEKIESGIIADLETSTMLRKANLQTQIAAESRKNAEVAVDVAEQQVKAVQKAIAAKEAEIAEHDSLFGQFKDYVSGLKKTADDLKDAKLDYGAMWASMQSGSGAAGMGGYGLFIYASYSSASAMADAANCRAADLKTLRYEVLPAAKEQVAVRNREVAIATLQGEVAGADAELAAELLKFQRLRFLSLEFWTHMATFMRRLLLRYLELGASAAWLAQRALAYEQNRDIDIIQFDYFPVQRQGVTGADMLQLHLAELEAIRLESATSLKPIKHTVSIATEFPLAFGQLKKNGHCVFRTEALMLQRAHPGTYWHRIRAVEVRSIISSAVPQIRGMLRNTGVSRISRLDSGGAEVVDVLVRPADALPMSEFLLAIDGTIHGLPSETLAPFEGSGVDTFWDLEIPDAANPHGRAPIADVLLTLHIDARYSAELFETHVATTPVYRRFIWLSAAGHDPDGLASLKSGTGTATLTFDMGSVDLPAKAKNWLVCNLACFTAGTYPQQFAANVASASPELSVPITFDDGVVVSNAAPFSAPGSTTPPSPLNQFVGKPAAQVFKVSIPKNPGTSGDFSGVTDMVFGVEVETAPA